MLAALHANFKKKMRADLELEAKQVAAAANKMREREEKKLAAKNKLGPISKKP